MTIALLAGCGSVAPGRKVCFCGFLTRLLRGVTAVAFKCASQAPQVHDELGKHI